MSTGQQLTRYLLLVTVVFAVFCVATNQIYHLAMNRVRSKRRQRRYGNLYRA